MCRQTLGTEGEVTEGPLQVTVETEPSVMYLQAKEHPGLLATECVYRLHIFLHFFFFFFTFTIFIEIGIYKKYFAQVFISNSVLHL